MPRPILKRSVHPPPLALDSPQSAPFPFPESSLRHVNFPTSSELCITHDVHSPGSYDRSPIVVDSNSCALPERGCPGRTYNPSRVPMASGGYSADSLHPRALAQQIGEADSARRQQQRQQQPQQQPQSQPQSFPTFNAPPPVHPCPDLSSSSSESDESSDGFASPPPELWACPINKSQFSASSTSYFTSIPSESISTTPTQDRPLSFLPHPNPHSPAQTVERPCPSTPFERRRRSKNMDEGTKAPKKNKSVSLYRTPAGLGISANGGGGGDSGDDGCLGGF